MRLISFAKTTEQFVEGLKTETRRDGWRRAHVGDMLQPVNRLPRVGAGKWWPLLWRGEYRHIQLDLVERVRLGDITKEQVQKEGFPEMSPVEFVRFYCAPRQPDPDRIVTRLSFVPVKASSIRSDYSFPVYEYAGPFQPQLKDGELCLVWGDGRLDQEPKVLKFGRMVEEHQTTEYFVGVDGNCIGAVGPEAKFTPFSELIPDFTTPEAWKRFQERLRGR